MPDENGLDLVPRIRKLRPDLRIIVMSAQSTLLTAVRATERGAFEYLPKPFDLNELISVVNRALSAPAASMPRGAHPPEESERLPLIGRSPAMQEIYRALARLMSTDLTVMVTGESGTGKELVARALHDYGKRRKGPFVALNMAAIPRELIESELFGHERGAFTGAVQRSAGKFEQASGGTLFLDEIGDMPPEAQTRLLRVLQEGEYMTVGGRTPIKANVRIVAATHRDLRRLIQQGLFREDLFYRLNVVPIRLPPLRERLDDIPELANHYLRAATADGLPTKVLSPEAMARLRQHRWPGNVRELENLVRRLSALYSEEVIGVETIETELADAVVGDRSPRPRRSASQRRHLADRRRRPPPAGAVRRPWRPAAAGRHVRSCHFRGRAAAAVAGAGGYTRESVARCPSPGAQSQYVAQEDKGPRRPRGSHAAGSPRRVTSVTTALGVSRLGDRMSAVLRGLSGRVAAVSLAVLAIVAGAATYAWLAGFVPASFGTRGWMTGLLVADLVIAIALVSVLAVRLTQLWLDRRRGAAGSRLHMRLVLVCSVFTITPTLIVAIILSLLFINLTDFVVKPSQASYEAARAIGEPVRRAREQEILNDIERDLRPAAGAGRRRRARCRGDEGDCWSA